MNYEQELEKSLKELKRVTGLSLSVDLEDAINLEDTVKQIRALSTAFKEKNNKNLIMRKWITGNMSEDEFYDIAKKLHIPFEEKRILYLIKTQNNSEEVIMILKNLFPSNSNMWLLPVNSSDIILLQSFYRKNPDPRKTSFEIVNTVSSEAFTQIKIAYSGITEKINDLPKAYQDAEFSMNVGEIFGMDEYVYGYDQLGIGRILYDVPIGLCGDYIRENLDFSLLKENTQVFEADMLYTVNCFLDNNLNIAETARQLHIHRNTLLYRLEQIEKETGLDIRQFNQAMIYKISSLILLKFPEIIK